MAHTDPTLAPDSRAISGLREPTGKGFGLVSFTVFQLHSPWFIPGLRVPTQAEGPSWDQTF